MVRRRTGGWNHDVIRTETGRAGCRMTAHRGAEDSDLLYPRWALAALRPSVSAMTLPQEVLGRTGLTVTKRGYGAMEVRGSRIWGGRHVEDAQAETILNAVLDSGITFIDTANDYGRSEEYIGRYLAHRRDEYVLATKCGCTVVHKDDDTDDTPHVWTRDNLFRGLHESLDRMKTDHIDLIQLHNPTVEQVESSDLIESLQEMKDQGKARW